MSEKDRTEVPLFGLERWQLEQVHLWIKEHGCKLQSSGAAGGKYTWCFTPTGLGTAQVVKCACGASLDVTDLESW